MYRTATPQGKGRTTGWLTLVAGLSLVLVAGATAYGQTTRRDTVTLTNKQILGNVTVLTENYREIQVDTDGDGTADRTISQNDVLRVEYGDAPAAYRQAMASFRLGTQYEKALEEFKTAATSTGVRPWLKDYVGYYMAECLRLQAQSKPAVLDAAVKAHRDALAASPEGPFRDVLLYGLGRLLLVQDKTADAAKEFDTLSRSAVKTEYRQGGQLGLANIQAKEGRLPDAIKLYDVVVQKGEEQSADVYREAVVGKAKAMLALKQHAQGIAFLEEALKKTKSVPLLTEGYATLGDCYYDLAESQKDPKEARSTYKEALYAFLHVEVLYSQDPDLLAKALFYEGKCFQSLKEDNRAQEKWAQLRSKFPGSPWLEKIR